MLGISSTSNNTRSCEKYKYLRKLKEGIVTFLKRLLPLRMAHYTDAFIKVRC